MRRCWNLLLLGMLCVLLIEPVKAREPAQDAETALREGNRKLLQAMYMDDALGEVIAYPYRGGVMLPLDRLMSLLGFPVFIDNKQGKAEGWYINDSNTLFLDAESSVLRVAGKEKPYPEALVLKDDKEIYVDASLLSRIFPLVFEVDYTHEQLHIRLVDDLPQTEKNWVAAHLGQPKEQAIWERYHAEEAEETADIDAEESDISLTESQSLIVQPYVGRYPQEEFFEVYQKGEASYIPLQVLTQLMEFPVQVDSDNHLVSGWFVDEERTIDWDIAEGKAAVNGKTYTIKPTDYIEDGWDIYVKDSLLESWFPLEFTMDTRALILTIQPTETLPFQARAEREKRWQQLQRRKQFFEDASKQYEIVTPSYERFSRPFIDIDLGQQYQSDSDDPWFSSYSLQSSGDIGYMNTETFISGDSNNDFLGNFRIRTGRTDYDGKLLGALKATEFRLGDINSETVPLVAQTSLGRGARVTNRPVGQQSEFDVTAFTGDALPGWEVELYRNDSLLDFQLVGNDGRYAFIDVPVLFGSNTFRLVFYGPQGQIEEQVEQVFADRSVVEAGQWIYALSVDEKSQDLLGVNDTTPLHPDGVRSVLTLEYGLLDNLSLSVGQVNTPIANGAHNYVTSGMKLSLDKIFLGGDIGYDVSEGGWASKVTALTGVEDIAVKLEQRFFSDFVSEEQSPTSELIKSQSEMDINMFRTLPLIKDINLALNTKYTILENEEEETSIGNRISKSLLGVNITHNLDMVFASTNRLDADLGIRGRVWGGVLLGTLVDYRIVPDKVVNRVNITAQKNITSKLNTRLGFEKDIDAGKRTAYRGSLNWDRERYRWGLETEVDDNGEVFTGITLGLSLGYNPRDEKWHAQSRPLSYSAAVSAGAYLDNNYNQTFDAGDRPLDDVDFIIGRRRIKAKGSDAYFTALVPHHNTNIRLDREKLEDTLWIPGIEGYTLRGRPGEVVNVNFPVQATSELDGTVYAKNAAGQVRPIKGVELHLLDQSGNLIQKTKTEYDGFYLIEKLLPGEYKLTISASEQKAHKIILPDAQIISIGAESDYYSGYDLTVLRTP